MPQKRFWGREQAKLVKSKNMHIIKTTAFFSSKFCSMIKTIKCCWWMVQTCTQQI